MRRTLYSRDFLSDTGELSRAWGRRGQGPDYVFTVKDNQPLLRKLLAAQDWELSPRYTE